LPGLPSRQEKFADKVESLTPKLKRPDPDAPFFDEEDMALVSGGDEEDTEPLITVEEIATLYETVHGKEQPSYSTYQLFPSTELPSSDLLAKPIISRSDTEFAKFIRALGNLDWVTQGHSNIILKARSVLIANRIFLLDLKRILPPATMSSIRMK
jgi:hypothetical protein